MKPIRLILVEDHALVRAGICALLKTFKEFEVVGEAGEGCEGLRLIRTLRPDLALLDITLPGMNGLEVAAQCARELPAVQILILSMHANEEYVIQSLRLGVRGYLLKDACTEELERAIRTVARGDIFLSPQVSGKVMHDYVSRLSGRSVQAAEGSPFSLLTSRQRQVLQLIAEGHTTREIAAKLNLSFKTIETHRTKLMSRLKINEVASLVRYAVRTGLVTND